MADGATPKSVSMTCPFCASGLVIVVAVAEDFKTIAVRCPSCHKESQLAVPPIR